MLGRRSSEVADAHVRLSELENKLEDIERRFGTRYRAARPSGRRPTCSGSSN
jgi:hypothetical protein